ncbi:kanamycin kinase [Saccharopolyspora antimicrobica]|uniref:Kanamycin kinase n=1 Tax=Saccharopolyspora antimicrobica TaxID=455193 RepID=A0A1I4WU92_9PSEU|nr:APH(3') family aminoglycoside O-phosphotransferase [Saccharopolyspora antimicrobica]RKT82949.1 kanamycin kinase [Saccharopolyspora antimicrobica]SFN17344.1 kanamycin kinase [Saccharopolyspora antimicrobica]
MTDDVRDGRWERIAQRSYGTAIYRVEGRRTYYVKTTPPRDPDDLRFHPGNEAERLGWLAGRGIPVPEVVELGESEDLQWLVTTMVPGRPVAGGWAPHELPRVLESVADLARALHELPAGECPFDRGLESSLAGARTAVERGTVDLDDLDPEHDGWSGDRLLAKLDATPPPPEVDVVVCHGDLCLDNVLVDPEGKSVTGVIDVGRLGVADRWLDLAIVLRDLGEETREWGYDPDCAEVFLRRYGLAEIDERRFSFYRLVDEFI